MLDDHIVFNPVKVDVNVWHRLFAVIEMMPMRRTEERARAQDARSSYAQSR